MNKENYKQYESLPKVAQEYFNEVLIDSADSIIENITVAANAILESNGKNQLLVQAFHNSDFKTIGFLLHKAIESELLDDAEYWFNNEYAPPSADQAEENAILAKADLLADNVTRYGVVV